MIPEIFVTLKKNSIDFGIAKRLGVNRKSNFEEILKAASRKLDIEAKILFAKDGAQIESADDIKDGDEIFVSQGEEFYKTASKKKVLKLGMFGSGSVGKSALSIRYVQKVFQEEYIPGIEATFNKAIQIDKDSVNLVILDTTGMEELVVMKPGWYKDREGFFLYIPLLIKCHSLKLPNFMIK